MEYDFHNNNNEGPAAWFVGELKNISREIETIFDDIQPMKPLTTDQQEEYNSAKICHICEDETRPFDQNCQSACKIYDHCHLTGMNFKNILANFI